MTIPKNSGFHAGRYVKKLLGQHKFTMGDLQRAMEGPDSIGEKQIGNILRDEEVFDGKNLVRFSGALTKLLRRTVSHAELETGRPSNDSPVVFSDQPSGGTRTDLPEAIPGLPPRKAKSLPPKVQVDENDPAGYKYTYIVDILSDLTPEEQDEVMNCARRIASRKRRSLE